jgi:hypothetical protein
MDTDTNDAVSARPGKDEDKTQFWRDHVDAWQASGKTQRGYATQHGLSVARFVYWKNKFYPRSTTKAAFVPVQITTTQHPVRLIHPNGVMIECQVGTEVSWLRSLLGLSSAP